MSEIFGTVYSDSYDLLYSDKDYGSECDLIERILREYGATTAERILDLGCGTGNHSIPLGARGYQVVGSDQSEAMLERARLKLEEEPGAAVEFIQGDLRCLDLGRDFDAVLMMFAVLGYQKENIDLRQALQTARQHLLPGGLLLFDVWYGPAVLHERPGDRIKRMKTAEGEMVRITSSQLDIRHHLCRVHFSVWRFNAKKIVEESQEEHVMRFFFPRELELLLEISGFELVRLGDFRDLNIEPDESTWNVMAVARAR